MRVILLSALCALAAAEGTAPLSHAASGSSASESPRNSTVDVLPGLVAHPARAGLGRVGSELSTMGDSDLEAAQKFMETYETALKDTADIAEFFGPEGEALAAGLKLVAGIVGLVDTLLGVPKPDPLKPVLDLIKKLWMAVDARFDALTVQIQGLKQQVLKSEIAVLFAEPEEVMIILTDEVKKLKTGASTNATFIQTVKPLVESGKFVTGFGVIRDCINGRNQACNIGGVSFVSQVGEALQWRPTLVSSFFAYYHCLLVQASTAYAAYQTVTGMVIDHGYATSIDTMGKAMQQYFSTTLRGNNFYLQMGNNKIPHVLDIIVSLHENKGKDGAAAIASAFRTEMAAYYDPVKWYRYWILAIVKSKTEYSIVGQPDGLNGGFGYVQNYKGYDIVYGFPTPGWHPTLPTDFSSCQSKASHSAKDTCNCIRALKPHLWFLMCYNGHHSYFYQVSVGAGYPGPLCQNTAKCPANPGFIYDVADKRSWFIMVG